MAHLHWLYSQWDTPGIKDPVKTLSGGESEKTPWNTKEPALRHLVTGTPQGDGFTRRLSSRRWYPIKVRVLPEKTCTSRGRVSLSKRPFNGVRLPRELQLQPETQTPNWRRPKNSKWRETGSRQRKTIPETHRRSQKPEETVQEAENDPRNPRRWRKNRSGTDRSPKGTSKETTRTAKHSATRSHEQNQTISPRHDRKILLQPAAAPPNGG